MLERGVVGAHLARAPQRLRRAGEIARAAPDLGLVAVERELAIRILDEGLLHREVLDGLAPLLLLLQHLAGRVDRVRVLRIELGEAAPVLERALRPAEGGIAPQATELFVHRRELVPHLGPLAEQRRQRFHEPLEQRHEGLLVALVAVELREPIRGGARRRILLDRAHERARGVVRVADGRGPHVGGLAEPVRGVGRIGRGGADLLEQNGVSPWVLRARAVRVSQRFLIVRVRDQALDERFHLPRIHGFAGKLHGPIRPVQRFHGRLDRAKKPRGSKGNLTARRVARIARDAVSPALPRLASPYQSTSWSSTTPSARVSTSGSRPGIRIVPEKHPTGWMKREVITPRFLCS